MSCLMYFITEELCLPLSLKDTLVIGISATALFDLSESDKLFKDEFKKNQNNAIEAYRKHMLKNEDKELNEGKGIENKHFLSADKKLIW